jgi:hypothetical protein
MPRKLIAIAAVATIAMAVTVEAQAMTAVRASTPRQAHSFVPRVAFKQLARVNGTTAQGVAFTRTPDGHLHLVYQTFAGKSLNGLASMEISAKGHPGSQVTVLSGWQAGQPGLVRQPNGTLEAIFGAVSPGNVSSVWGVTSSDGASWSAPADVKGGGSLESLAYGSDVTAAPSSGNVVVTLPQAGRLIIQRGLGSGSPSYELTNPSDGSTADADVATDATTGEVVTAWNSISGNPTLYVQGASPSIQSLQKVPGQSRNEMELAGRDAGPGVYGAYTPDGQHVLLLRYGGKAVRVGSVSKTKAKDLGVATGPAGRIWVMWGDDAGGGVNVTRSNKAVNAFEPIQHLNLKSAVLYRISGDGRLGPLDLLVDQIPDSGTLQPPSLYYARVLAELSAHLYVAPIKNKRGQVIAHLLRVTVTDAGDRVAGAVVTARGVHKTTDATGTAQFKWSYKVHGGFTVGVTKAGYWRLTKTAGF